MEEQWPTIVDTGNHNLTGTQIIGTRHTIEEISIRGWWLFSREITGENREKAHGSRKEGEERKAATNREGETRHGPLVKEKSPRSECAFSSVYRLWKSLLFLLLQVAKNTLSTRRFDGPWSQANSGGSWIQTTRLDKGKLNSTRNDLLLSLRSVTRNSRWKRTKTVGQSSSWYCQGITTNHWTEL